MEVDNTNKINVINKSLINDDNINDKFKMDSICSCKGIRTCNKCKQYKNNNSNENTLKQSINIISLDDIINKRKVDNKLYEIWKVEINKTKFLNKMSNSNNSSDSNKLQEQVLNYITKRCDIFNKESIIFDIELIFDGLYIIPNSLSEHELLEINKELQTFEWKESQSGRKKMDFGPKINYKKQKIKFSSNDNS